MVGRGRTGGGKGGGGGVRGRVSGRGGGYGDVEAAWARTVCVCVQACVARAARAGWGNGGYGRDRDGGVEAGLGGRTSYAPSTGKTVFTPAHPGQ